MAEISVIVPIYNAEHGLRRCIESIIHQTFSDFELILVDDGSSDDCPSICDEYAQKDFRVHVVHQENQGVSAARNKGLCIAKGTYILFVDSDDYLALDYISRLYSCKSELVICGMEVQDETGALLYSNCPEGEFYSSQRYIDYPKMYRGNMLYSPYCKLFQREIIEKYGVRFLTNISWGEDGIFVADYISHVNAVRVLDYVGYFYVKYIGEQTLSTKIRENIIEMIVFSREYCINKMQTTSPKDMEEVKKICTEDIRQNCSYFVNLLLDSKTVKRDEKIKLLREFMRYEYVMDGLKNPDRYYKRNILVQSAVRKIDARVIVSKYYRQLRKVRRHRWLYNNIYERMPSVVKKNYRRVKERINR